MGNRAELIPVIDLFAGPGGLAEGFSSFLYNKQNIFKVCLSIERDLDAFRTLRLRSLFRKVPFEDYKLAFQEFCKSSKTPIDEENLFSNFSAQFRDIQTEVMCKELGHPEFSSDYLDHIIKTNVGNAGFWVLIGGPPCQAYSLVGRARMSRLRKANISEYEKDVRHYLYRHYLRILSIHTPPVFVMENVKGILSSKINGKSIFSQIIDDLKRPPDNADVSYNLYSFVSKQKQLPLGIGNDQIDVNDFIIKSEDYGVPQMRHRVIILGIRSDLPVAPSTLKERPYKISVKDVISDLPRIRSSVTSYKKNGKDWGQHIREVMDCIIANDRIDSGLLKLLEKKAKILEDFAPTGDRWLAYSPGRPNKLVKALFRSDGMIGVCNHMSRCHMPEDLKRYFFSACFALHTMTTGHPRSPRLADFPFQLIPNHKNINLMDVNRSIFDDRFRVQIECYPSSTITSHIAKDGHYYIHPDPCQCRSLTVREAARLQTFPDSYIFLGSRTSQYQQVGNAVPPLLSRQLAGVVFRVLKQLIDKVTNDR